MEYTKFILYLKSAFPTTLKKFCLRSFLEDFFNQPKVLIIFFEGRQFSINFKLSGNLWES
jgi:hypothetical protein